MREELCIRPRVEMVGGVVLRVMMMMMRRVGGASEHV